MRKPLDYTICPGCGQIAAKIDCCPRCGYDRGCRLPSVRKFLEFDEEASAELWDNVDLPRLLGAYNLLRLLPPDSDSGTIRIAVSGWNRSVASGEVR